MKNRGPLRAEASSKFLSTIFLSFWRLPRVGVEPIFLPHMFLLSHLSSIPRANRKWHATAHTNTDATGATDTITQHRTTRVPANRSCNPRVG